MFNRIVTIVSIVTVLAGAFYLFSERASTTENAVVIVQKPLKLAEFSKPKLIEPSLDGVLHITSEQLGIDTRVEHGYQNIASNAWTSASDRAFYTEASSTPMIYGHNSKTVFAGLKNAEKDTKFVLTYKNSTKEYSYVATRFVDPNNAEVLREENKGMIMLMTCSGAFNEVRRIIYLKELS